MHFTPQYILAQATREKFISKLKSIPPFHYGNEQTTRKAAVLVPFCVVNEKVSLLYTVRSSQLKNYSGQISFPGGKVDADDENLTATALRETEEELGYPRSKIEVWGEGSEFPTRRSELLVTPVIGFLPDLNISKLNPNRDEVEEVFTVPLEELCRKENMGYTKFHKYTLPVFFYGDKKIWGLTAFTTHAVLGCLFSSDIYTNDFGSKKGKMIEISKL